MKGRIFWIDGLRTFAILGMILYHILFDYEFFYGKDINLFGNFWQGFRIIIAGIFIFLSGYSLNLSKNPFRQGMILLLLSFVVSAVTFWYLPERGIYFGILHLLGVGYLTGAVWFRYLPVWIVGFCGIISFILSFCTDQFPLYLLPFGGGNHYFHMMDYFPICPWLTPFLVGLIAGQKKWLPGCFYATSSHWNVLFWPGRHSLIIYLIHQPILLGMFYLLQIK